ncbi:MAG TPA: hypothetical protein DCM86_09780 [Verrucomicrobiales bacterium]|nr:hypothetical protein [Verrucomicrobiales bacterium]
MTVEGILLLLELPSFLLKACDLPLQLCDAGAKLPGLTAVRCLAYRAKALLRSLRGGCDRVKRFRSHFSGALAV